jgi:hypothetical protein
LVAMNFDQGPQDQNSSRPISRKRRQFKIHRDQFRENAASSKFIATNFEQTPQVQNSSRPILNKRRKFKIHRDQF